MCSQVRRRKDPLNVKQRLEAAWSLKEVEAHGIYGETMLISMVYPHSLKTRPFPKEGGREPMTVEF